MSDVTLKVNEGTFGEIFNKIWPGLQGLSFAGSGSWAGLWGGIEGEFHVVDAGKVEFNDSDSFTASEIDIKWDKLIFRVGLDIPSIRVGKFCMLPIPEALEDFLGEGCLVEFPGAELFTKVPDIYIKLNLNAIIQFIITEISIISKVKVEHTSKPPNPDYWGIYLDLVAVNVDPIDIQDTLGQSGLILAGAIGVAVTYILSAVPYAFMVDVLLGVLGFPSVSEYILDILDIQDSVEEWLMRWLNISIGIDQLIYQQLFDAILSSTALYKINDPVILMTEEIPADPTAFGGFGPAGTDATAPGVVTLSKVEVRVKQPDVTFTDDEMVVAFDLEK